MYLPSAHEFEMGKKKPRKYLDEYAVIVNPRHKEAYYRTENDRHENPIEYQHINIKQYDEALAAGRLALLKKEYAEPEEFAGALYLLKRIKLLDFEQFYKQIWK